jgi:hypothetical protein
MSNPTIKCVINSIDGAILKAQDTYKNVAWLPLHYGPEYFLTTTIFYSLVDLTQRDSLTLESKPYELYGFLQLKNPTRGRPPKVPEGARLEGCVDICLWKIGEDIPRAMIEVKRCATDWVRDPCDITRVAHSTSEVKGRRSFEFGILASCLHEKEINNDKNKAEEIIKEKLEEVSQAVRSEVKKVGKDKLVAMLKQSITYPLPLKDDYGSDSENWIWRPVIFEICRK